MARERAEQAARETTDRWPEIVTVSDLVREIRSGKNGTGFLDDLAEAMKPKKRRP